MTTRRGEYAPPILEERMCWDPSIPGMGGKGNTCSMAGGGNAFWNINGKTVEVDIAEDQCLCFQDLCNGADLPTGGGMRVGSTPGFVGVFALIAVSLCAKVQSLQ